MHSNQHTVPLASTRPALQLHLGVDTKGDHFKLGERWLRVLLFVHGKQADWTNWQKPCCFVPCIAAGRQWLPRCPASSPPTPNLLAPATLRAEQQAVNDCTFRVPDQRGWQPKGQLIDDHPGCSLSTHLHTDLDVSALAGGCTALLVFAC